MLKGKTILIIDDEPYTRDTISLILELYGHKTMEACDGIQAFQILQSHPVDLIIMDIQMPRMNGMVMLDEMKRRAIKIPVVLITGYGNPGVVTELYEKGQYRILFKPFSENDILEKVEDALGAVV